MKIFGFVKKVFFVGLSISLGFTNANSLNAIPLSCISMNNQECKTRPQVINVNGDEPVFFPFSIETSNVVVVIIILTTRMQHSMFLMLQKT